LITVLRQTLEFSSGQESCAATLFLPKDHAPESTLLPCVVLANTMGATRADGLDAFAEAFALAGFAALTFDYRSFGESSGMPRQVVSVKGQIADFHCAIEFAKTMPRIDPNRIALWGASLAGGHVVSVGATRSDLRAIVSIAPTADCLQIALSIPKKLLLQLVWAANMDLLRILLGQKPHYVPVVASPGELAAMNTPEVLHDYERMVGTGSLWRNRLAARLFLLFPTYRPIAKAARVSAPLLVAVCDQDDIASPQSALAMAQRAPAGEAKHYPANHLNGLLPPLNADLIVDQIQFLKKHV
jgi:uncharacterized protein